MAAMTDKARVSEFAFYDLDKALRRTNETTETFTGGQSRLERGTRNNAQALLLFSQGFEDAQYGIRGVLNNIPSLIFALGGSAGLAGAISIAAVGLTQIIPLFQKTEEEAGKTADRIKEVADYIGESQGIQIDDLRERLKLSNEQADASREKIAATAEAERNYAASAIENAESIADSNRTIAELLDRQVDAYAELEAQQERETQRRKLAADAEIAAQRKRIETANEKVAKVGQELQAEEIASLESIARLQRAQKELELLRQQRDELQKIAEGRANLSQPFGPGLGDLQNFANQQLQRPGSFAGFQAAVAGRAQSTLEGDEFQQKLANAERIVESLAQRVQTISGETGVLAQLGVKLADAQSARDDEVRAALIEIEKSTQSSAYLEAKSKLTNIRDQSAQLATDLQETFGKIETTNATQAAAKESLKKATDDGVITAQEVDGIAANLRTLIGGLQSGLSSSSESVGRLLAIQEQFSTTFANFQERLTRLEGAVRQIGNQ